MAPKPPSAQAAQFFLICWVLFVSVPTVASSLEQQPVAEVDSVFVTTRSDTGLRTKVGIERLRVPGGIRLLALDYDDFAWDGRWLVQYADQLVYVRDTDVISSDADKQHAKSFALQAKSFALEREAARVAPFREQRSTLLANKYWISSAAANVRDTPTRDGTPVAQLRRDDAVYVLERQGDWSKVVYDGPILVLAPEKDYRTVEEYRSAFRLGWIHSSLMNQKDPWERLLEAPNDRRKMFVNGHPDLSLSFKSAILAGHVALGMSREMVTASLGGPIDINRSVGSWGTHEQWIYRNIYVYVENGVVTSWQDHAGR